MENEKAVEYIEKSFLSSLVIDPDVTDISFNGQSIFYQHNLKGRQKSSILINQGEAKDFIRQIANLTEQQFSFQNPQLDVSVGKYRIHAVHQSIGRIGNKPAVTISIRIASDEPKITRENGYLTNELEVLFDVLIKSNKSLLIGGTTGCGKTEFQKYLIREMDENQRIIIIDNVLELEQVRLNSNCDINSWQVDERNPYASIQNLVRSGLRSNPDWMIIAEARGGEMSEILNSAMTGHPIITTIHSENTESMLQRATRMVMMSDKKTDYTDVLQDVVAHFKYLIYLEKEILKDGTVKRYISEVGEVLHDGSINKIYKRNGDKHIYRNISKDGLNSLKIDESIKPLFMKTFNYGQ